METKTATIDGRKYVATVDGGGELISLTVDGVQLTYETQLHAHWLNFLVSTDPDCPPSISGLRQTAEEADAECDPEPLLPPPYGEVEEDWAIETQTAPPTIGDAWARGLPCGADDAEVDEHANAPQFTEKTLRVLGAYYYFESSYAPDYLAKEAAKRARALLDEAGGIWDVHRCFPDDIESEIAMDQFQFLCHLFGGPTKENQKTVDK